MRPLEVPLNHTTSVASAKIENPIVTPSYKAMIGNIVETVRAATIETEDIIPVQDALPARLDEDQF